MRRNAQADEEVGGRVVEGEDAVGLLRLLDDGFDVADLRDRFQNLLLLGPVGAALLFGLLDHLVVLPHQSPPQPRLLVLPHLQIFNSRCFPAFSSLVDDDEYGDSNAMAVEGGCIRLPS